jgi:vitamin B12/bleomycin/antimicrobial peptide transport system ATP-binding/permease protein
MASLFNNFGESSIKYNIFGSDSESGLHEHHTPLDTNEAQAKPEVPSLAAITALAKPFFVEKSTRWRAWFLAAGSVIFIAAETLVIMWYSYVNKELMSALQQKDPDGFYDGVKQIGLVIIAILPILCLEQFLANIFMLSWRIAMTHRFAGRYFNKNMFYQMHIASDVDNPDQRICQDINDFVAATFNLLQNTVGTVFQTLGFIGILYSISPMACLGVVVYSLAGTLASVKGFAPYIMKYQFLTLKQEADLRYGLIRTRENAESIAFFNGGGAEWDRFKMFFDVLVGTLYRQIVVNVCFGTFTRAFNFFPFLVPTLIVAPAYLRGEVEFGAISQAQTAFGIVLGGLSVIIGQLSSLTDLAVRVKRLRLLEECLLREEGCDHIDLQELNSTRPDDLPVLRLEEMTLRTPLRPGALQQTIIEGLSFHLEAGNSILVVGDSGVGKSSLLRAISGLWKDGSGTIARAGGKRIFFLPQKPYMFLGTLREQLLYPDIDRFLPEDNSVETALSEVNLSYLLERHSLDDAKEWTNILSGGEQQRINFARCLLQRNLELALVDEGTSACDAANEARLYELLGRRVQSYVSVGHRPALRRYHSHVLWLRRSSAEERCLATASFLTMADYERALEGS